MYSVTPAKISDTVQGLPRQTFIDLTLLDTEVGSDCRFPPHQRVVPPTRVQVQLLSALELSGDDRVLQVGVGFGLNTVALASLVQEVVAVDCEQSRARFAQRMLKRLGRHNTRVVIGDPIDNPQVQEEFDAILVEAATGEVPPGLFEQLKPGGRLVTCLPTGAGCCQLVRYSKEGDDELHRESLGTIDELPSLAELLSDLSEETRERSRQIAAQGGVGAEVGLVEALEDVTEKEKRAIYQALSNRRGITIGRTEELLSRLQPGALDILPRPFLKKHRLVPVEYDKTSCLLATPDPYVDLESIELATECENVQLVLVRPGDYRRIWRAIELEQFGSEDRRTDPMVESAASLDRFSEPGGAIDPDDKQRHKTIFRGILVDAVGERASDIHLERYDQRVRVRFRIDGECVDMTRYQITPEQMRGIVNVVKINAGLDIAERRLPQGGRMGCRIDNREFDLRIQTQPTHHGEYVVIRLLPQDNQMLSIRDLGLFEQQARQYERMLSNPSGLLLVVGPTGSGKSTTLYAGLQPLARDATRKVITAEDPVEYSIDNIQQTQIQPLIGFHFADAMRSFVRQDPDVILVGEIRDEETALEAIRASQTGHLVLSALHSNDAVDAVQRLFDLQMHANSIASELMGVIAQRLARRICRGCRQPVSPDPAIAAEVFPGGIPEGFQAYRGQGCGQCEQRGTHGRVAVVEFLRVNASIRRAISRRLQVDELRQRCLDSGLVPMREAALNLVQNGVIPFEEIRRILPEERMTSEVN